MNKKLIASTLALFGFAATAVQAGVGVTGPAVRGATSGIAVGDFFAFIVSTDGTSFSTISFTSGEPLNLASSYGSGFAVVQTGSVISSFAVNTVSANFTTEFVNGISQGDAFAVVTFDNSLNNASGALSGDSFKIWTNPAWVIPADGSNFTFTTGTVGAANYPSITNTLPNITGTVSGGAIPEPSSFALIAGFAAVGLVATRRRRA